MLRSVMVLALALLLPTLLFADEPSRKSRLAFAFSGSSTSKQVNEVPIVAEMTEDCSSGSCSTMATPSTDTAYEPTRFRLFSRRSRSYRGSCSNGSCR